MLKLINNRIQKRELDNFWHLVGFPLKTGFWGVEVCFDYMVTKMYFEH
jgi:hypothetical protein